MCVLKAQAKTNEQANDEVKDVQSRQFGACIYSLTVRKAGRAHSNVNNNGVPKEDSSTLAVLLWATLSSSSLPLVLRKEEGKRTSQSKKRRGEDSRGFEEGIHGDQD